jgi:hypothetical protein
MKCYIKILYLSGLCFLCLEDLKGQSQEDIFKDIYEDMFHLPEDMYVPQTMPPDPPPVPLDGGLTALLLAGGAAGYRQYQKKKKA